MSWTHIRALVFVAALFSFGCGQQNSTGSADSANKEETPQVASSDKVPPFPTSMNLEDANKRFDEAVAIIKSGKAQDGFNQLNDILKLCPQCAKAWDLRANMLAQAGQPVSAIRDLSELLKLQPDQVEAWNMRGYLYLTLNKFPEAIKDFDQAIQLNPKFYKAYNNRGLARIAQKDYGNSLNDFNLAIQHKEDYVDAYNNRGYALLEIGNYAKAIQNFSDALKLDPNYANAYNNRGLVRIKTGEVEEAIKDFTQAIAIVPYVEKHYQHRRDAYLTLGKEELGKADEQKIILIRELVLINEKLLKNPKQLDLIVNRGQHFLKMNDLAKAQQDFDLVLKNAADHLEAQTGLAQIALANKQYDKAIELCDKVIAQDQSLAAHSIRGDACFAQGQFDQAVRDYQLAQRFDQQVAKAFQQRATWHEKEGRKDQAAADLESARMLDPTTQSTAKADGNPRR